MIIHWVNFSKEQEQVLSNRLLSHSLNTWAAFLQGIAPLHQNPQHCRHYAAKQSELLDNKAGGFSHKLLFPKEQDKQFQAYGYSCTISCYNFIDCCACIIFLFKQRSYVKPG